MWRALLEQEDAPRVRALQPYADYLADMGLDQHAVNVVRDGGYFDLDLRWCPWFDTWTEERLLQLGLGR